MPDWRPDLRERLASVRLSPEREAEIVEELSQHLEDRYDELVASGLAPEAARRQALEGFHDPGTLAHRLAALRQARWVDPAPPAAARAPSWGGLAADVRRALRALRAAPAFTVAALLLLALGIGATTAIFSIVDALVLRRLPFEQPERLVAIGERVTAARGSGGPGKGPIRSLPGAPPEDPEALRRIEPQNYLDWVASQRVFESFAAIDDRTEVALERPGSPPEAILVTQATASFFDVLRAHAAVGRLFTREHEVDGRQRVVVLSDRFWRRLGGDPTVLGRTLTIDGTPYEVLGILPASFDYPVGTSTPADAWVPYVVPPEQRVRGGRGRAIYLQSVARLKPDVSVTEAQAQMDQIAASLATAHPDTNTGHGIGVRPLADHLVGAKTRTWALMLFGAVGIVLLIACANVANLWLARASIRDREAAIRAALGAGRWRLVRLALIESLLVSAAGTCLGLGVAWQAIRILKAALPDTIPAATIGVDLRVLAVAAALSVGTAVLAGLVPALQASTPSLVSVFGDARGSAGPTRARRRLRAALLVIEVALALVLLVGAALFATSFANVMRLDLGFRPDGILSAQIFQRRGPGATGRPDLGAAMTDIVERVRHLPGVIEAAISAPGMPLRVNMTIDALRRPGLVTEDPTVSIKVVTPGYWRALGIPLSSGRLVSDEDRLGTAPVIVLSEAAARVFFPGEDPIGRTATLAGVERTVVGVVASARQSTVEVDPHPEVYLPMAQIAGRSSGYLVIRTSGAPEDALPAVRTAVAAVLPDVPLRNVSTLERLVAGQTAQRRLNMLVVGLFGLLGLVIAAVGLFGVMAYLVAQRTREIGVRMSLGASRAQVMAMVLRQAAGLVLAGLAAGGVAAWYLAAAAERFLFRLHAHDLRAFAIAAATLLAAGLLASLLPARRAASVDPTVALRAE